MSIRTPPEDGLSTGVPSSSERAELVERVARAIYNSRIPKGGKNYCAFDDLCSHDYREDYDRVMSDARAVIEATALPALIACATALEDKPGCPDPVYYLRSIMRQLQEFQEIATTSESFYGPTIATEVLADNIDWLDCFADEIERKRAALAKSGAEQ